MKATGGHGGHKNGYVNKGLKRLSRSGKMLTGYLNGRENRRKQRVAKLLAQSKFSAGVKQTRDL